MNSGIGIVSLNTLDLESMTLFYERSIGLETLDRNDRSVRLGTSDNQPLIELVHHADTEPRPTNTTGLFHLALLVPDRISLAHALARAAGTGARLSGAADHGVSEAIYLNDPEENGIEIYRDRPSEDWARVGESIQMGTLPLDLQQLLAEVEQESDTPEQASPETTIGHVHLQVADLAEAERFYVEELGLDVTVRAYPGALFLSYDGYHHHIGMNTWASEGAPPPPKNSTGLNYFELIAPVERSTPILDPSGNEIHPTVIEPL